MDITEALANYMHNSYGLDVKSVVSWDDDTESGGYCESCYYEYAVVRVVYLDSNDVEQRWNYSDSFSDLIRNL